MIQHILTSSGQVDPLGRSAPPPQVSLLLKESFENFEKVVRERSPDGSVLFANSTVEDVYQTAREIERELEEKCLLRNLRRVTRFLEALARFKSEIAGIEDMCPYLTWILVYSLLYRIGHEGS